jgi:DNA-binding XRE family transcriptional regulator
MPRKHDALDEGLRRLGTNREPGRVYTQTEIADACGVSRQTVNKIELRALEKMRRKCNELLALERLTQ